MIHRYQTLSIDIPEDKSLADTLIATMIFGNYYNELKTIEAYLDAFTPDQVSAQIEQMMEEWTLEQMNAAIYKNFYFKNKK